MDTLLRTVWDKYKKHGFLGLLLILIREVLLDRAFGTINEMIDRLLATSIPKWIPDILRWIFQDPFHIVSVLGALIIIGIFVKAYLDMRPARGIKVSHKEISDGVLLIITNDTEHNLDNAYLAINWIKPEPEPARGRNGINYHKLLFGAPLPDPLIGTELFWEIDGDYLNRTIIESKRSAKSHSIKVESTGEAGFWVNKYTERSLLTQSSRRSIRPIIYFDKGELNAEIRFGGTRPDGKVLIKVFELELDYDGIEVKVKRIVQ